MDFNWSLNLDGKIYVQHVGLDVSSLLASIQSKKKSKEELSKKRKKRKIGIKDKRSSNAKLYISSFHRVRYNAWNVSPRRDSVKGNPLPPPPANYLSDPDSSHHPHVSIALPPHGSSSVPFESSSRPISSPPPEGVRSLWSTINRRDDPSTRESRIETSPFSFESIESFVQSISRSYYCYPLLSIVEWISFFFSSSFLNDSIQIWVEERLV